MINLSTSLIKYSTVVFFGVSVSFANPKNVDLAKEKVTVQMKKRPLGEVFRFLMGNYNVPIGFERSNLDIRHTDYNFETNQPSVAKLKVKNADDSIETKFEFEREFRAEEHTITLDIKNGTLKDAMDQIVSQMNNYTWEFNSGVVNIFPVKGRDDRCKEMLEMKIAKFTLQAGSTVEDITHHLIILPEFQQWLKENKLHINPARPGFTALIDAQYRRKLDNGMAFSNITFRDLLNEITKIKKGGWIFKQTNFYSNGEAYMI